MILDNLLMFTGTSNGATAGVTIGPQTDRPTTGAQVSSNVIDLHMLGIPVLAANEGARDMGIGDDPAIKILAIVTSAMLGGTSLTLALQGAPDDGTGNPGTFVTWWTSPAYTLAQLDQGSQLFNMDMPRPPDGVSEPRFLRFAYTGAGTFNGGAIEICLVLDRMDQFYQGTNNAILGGYKAGIVVAN